MHKPVHILRINWACLFISNLVIDRSAFMATMVVYKKAFCALVFPSLYTEFATYIFTPFYLLKTRLSTIYTALITITTYLNKPIYNYKGVDL